eukprot:16117502-Heterocapsa_arctica.AAC.1
MSFNYFRSTTAICMNRLLLQTVHCVHEQWTCNLQYCTTAVLSKPNSCWHLTPTSPLRLVFTAAPLFSLLPIFLPPSSIT